VTSERPLVLLSQRLGQVTDEERRLETAGARVESAALGDLDAIRANAADAAVIIVGAVEPFDAAAIAALPQTHALVRRGVGHDNVDIAAATKAGIVVANVPDASVEEVSDHAFASLLALERRLFELQALVRDGVWSTDPAAIQHVRTGSRRFADLTLGVVGFGRIGQAMVRKARGTHGRVQVYDVVTPSPERLDGVPTASLADLLATSDHISLHIPMAPESRHLVGADELASMRPGAIIVNTARGGLIDEDALAKALRNGPVALAALDVTAQEPVDLAGPLGDPEIADRLLLTAHSAAWSVTAATALAVGSVDAARDLLAGELPVSVVNPEVLGLPALRNTRLGRARGQPGGSPAAHSPETSARSDQE
jgi:D-3-phosphoglycerate dehydrogenase / 2-oxoglutarate reductase